MNKITMGIMTLLLIFCSACGEYQHTNQIDEYRIGSINPLSGWGAYWGIPNQQGTNMAIEYVNSNGGIRGVPVKVIYEDSQVDPKQSIMAANKLVNLDNVHAVHAIFAPPVNAVAPFLNEKKVPLIYDAYQKSPVQNSTSNFKSFIDPELGCEMLIKHALENGAQKIGAIVARFEYNEVCVKKAKIMYPELSEYWYNFGETDFRSLFLKAKDDNVDTILILGWADEFLPFFEQKKELGYDFNILCGTSVECLTEDVIGAVGADELQGVVSFDYTDLSETEFAKQYKAKYPLATNSDLTAAAHGYEAMILFTEAMKLCVEVTRDCIVAQLPKVSNYNSALKSNGFKDKVLQIETQLYEFKENGLVAIN